jgi:hypothetical protein
MYHASREPASALSLELSSVADGVILGTRRKVDVWEKQNSLGRVSREDKYFC